MIGDAELCGLGWVTGSAVCYPVFTTITGVPMVKLYLDSSPRPKRKLLTMVAICLNSEKG